MPKMIFDTRQLPPYLTVEQTAAMVQVDVQIVRRMCRNGQLPAAKIGTLWRIDKNRLIEQLSAPAVLSRESSTTFQVGLRLTKASAKKSEQLAERIE